MPPPSLIHVSGKLSGDGLVCRMATPVESRWKRRRAIKIAEEADAREAEEAGAKEEEGAIFAVE